MSEANGRERILRVSTELFAKKGYKGTSIRDIVEKANISISMISYYFGGKIGILEEILDKILEELSPVLLIDSEVNEAEFLRKVEDILILIEKNPYEFRIIINELQRDLAGIEHIKEDFHKVVDNLKHSFFKVSGVDENLLEIKIYSLAELWISMIISNYFIDFNNIISTRKNFDPEIMKKTKKELIISLFELFLNNKDHFLKSNNGKIRLEDREQTFSRA